MVSLFFLIIVIPQSEFGCFAFLHFNRFLYSSMLMVFCSPSLGNLINGDMFERFLNGEISASWRNPKGSICIT